MQLRFTQRTLEPEEQPVVEVPGIIDAILVEDQRAGECGEFEESMPVGVIAGEPGYFEAEHDARVTECHLADEFLEAVAVLGVCAGDAKVAVDRADALDRPAKRHRALTKRILALGALRVLEDLAQRRLADVQERVASQVIGVDLLMVVSRHASPPTGSG